jgi:hypothetical protein
MTLDHYLPKAQYSALAVNPINLIPACTDCNKIKLSSIEPTLHAYYDNVETEVWLHARVLPRNPVAVQFFVECPKTWPLALSDKVASHFRIFELNSLYMSQAARAISGYRQLLDGLLAKGGEMLVRSWLNDQSQTWRAYEINCWESALYEALAADSWFCSGGFSIT